MSVRLKPVSHSITFGRSAEPSPSIEKTAKNPSFLEWIGQKLPISNQADDLITAYQGEVIPHRPITPEEREILQNAAQNWTPLGGDAEKAAQKAIVPPNRAGSVAAHGLTAATTIGGAAAGQFVPSAETDLRAIDNFVWHKTPPVDADLPSALPPAPGTGVLNESAKVLTDQVQEQVINKHWHLHWPWEHLPASPPVDPVVLGKTVGAASLGTLGATKGTLGALGTAKAGAALTGWGLGASAGLGVGIVSSLIIAPLIALSQHVQNRNIMAAMAKIYDNPPEVVPAEDGAPPTPPPSIPVKNAGNPLEPLTDKVQETVQGWASKLPSWLPLSNDPSGLTRDFEKIAGRKPEPHQEKALRAASNNWLPPLIGDLGNHEEDTIVRPDKAGVGVAHTVALATPILATPLSAVPWIIQKASEGIGWVLNPVAIPVPTGLQNTLHLPAVFHPLSAPFNGLAGLIKSATGGKAILIPLFTPIAATAAKVGIVAGAIAAPIAAYAQHIRNRNIMAAWAETDKPGPPPPPPPVTIITSSIETSGNLPGQTPPAPATPPAEKSTPSMLKLLKENGPFNDLIKDGKSNKPAANNLNKAFNATGIINP